LIVEHDKDISYLNMDQLKEQMKAVDAEIFQLKQFIHTFERDQLLKNRKLVLLVDLDQTILHTSLDTSVGNAVGVLQYELGGGRSQRRYQTRLRPHANTFLRNMSQLFEMRVCTLGTREYACKMTSLLDKDGHYFGGRIISREDIDSTTSKRSVLSSQFSVGDNLMVIIDDQRKVWGSAPNLIDVKPYVFFGHSNKNHFNDDDDYLIHLEGMLRNIHRDFYRVYDAAVLQPQGSIPHVKSFLPNTLQRPVKRLRNCDQQTHQITKRRTLDHVYFGRVGLV